MATKLTKNGLHSIYRGLQTLSDNKPEYLSALSEVLLLLNNSETRERHQPSDCLIDFLESVHFLLKDLTLDSVKIITDHITEIEESI